MSRYLYQELIKSFKVKRVDYKEIIKLKKINYEIIINCKLEKNFLSKLINDNYFEIKLLKKLTSNNKYIYFSSSKALRKKDYYGKNKLYIEKRIKELSTKNNFNYIILRISNIVYPTYSVFKKKFLITTFDTMINTLKFQKIIYLPQEKIYKDFISVNDVTKIICILIKKNISGSFNLGSGFKYYLNEVAIRLIRAYKRGSIVKIKKNKTDSFLINSKKIQNITRYKIYKKTVLSLINKLGESIV